VGFFCWHTVCFSSATWREWCFEVFPRLGLGFGIESLRSLVCGFRGLELILLFKQCAVLLFNNGALGHSLTCIGVKCLVRRDGEYYGVAALILRVAAAVLVRVCCCRGVCSRCSVKLTGYSAWTNHSIASLGSFTVIFL